LEVGEKDDCVIEQLLEIEASNNSPIAGIKGMSGYIVVHQVRSKRVNQQIPKFNPLQLHELIPAIALIAKPCG
jgi:hypothetical protein